MSSENLNIARPGNLIWPGTRISPIKWHVGGQPWYPAECSVPDPSQLICGVCGERLKHILHVALPPLKEPKESPMHALMYLFVCIKSNCGKESGSWRALRCQWHSPPSRTTREHSSNAKIGGTKLKPATTLTTAGWGLGDPDTDKETDNSNKPASGGFDFSDLEAALDAMNQKQALASATTSTTKSIAAVEEEEEEKVDEFEVELIQQEDEPIPLPGFYLEVAESQLIENRIEKQSGIAGGGGGSRSNNKDDTLEHIHELLEKYGETTSEGEIERLINYEDDDDEEEEEEEEEKRKAKQKVVSRGKGGTKGQEDIADSVTWDGERYEEDVVLAVDGRKGVDQIFLKFMKKLQRVPDQCVRQGRGGDGTGMLWPSNKNIIDPGVCSCCGAPRVFEYQLMAPTISALEESADWLKEEGLEDGVVERPPASWDWVTVAVFGCRDRCWGGSKGGYREEKVVIICEEE